MSGGQAAPNKRRMMDGYLGLIQYSQRFLKYSQDSGLDSGNLDFVKLKEKKTKQDFPKKARHCQPPYWSIEYYFFSFYVVAFWYDLCYKDNRRVVLQYGATEVWSYVPRGWLTVRDGCVSAARCLWFPITEASHSLYSCAKFCWRRSKTSPWFHPPHPFSFPHVIAPSSHVLETGVWQWDTSLPACC